MGAALASIAILAPLAVVSLAPAADAASVKRHDIITYKREGWVAVAGSAGAEADLACDVGDHAVDGMWKVDAYDGDPRALRVLASHASQDHPQTWDFRFRNAGTGRAQVKLFVTCLSDQTGEASWHQHDLVVDPLKADVRPGLAVGLADLEHSPGCRADQIPVAPGFSFTNGVGVVVASLPSADRRSWQWSFVLAEPSAVTLSLRCLDRRTSVGGAGGHVHEVDGQLSTPTGGQVSDLAPGVNDRSVVARKQDDGIVGAFSLTDWDRVSYLGQDPQGQVRGFRFQVTGPSVGTAWIGIWGVDKRTSRQLAP